MSEAETGTTDTGTPDTDAAEADAPDTDATEAEPPTLNLGPSYEEIKKDLEQSPEKYAYGRSDDDQDYVDRDSIDFDPADGLYTGTEADRESEAGNESDANDGTGTADAEDSHPAAEAHDRPTPGPGTSSS